MKTQNTPGPWSWQPQGNSSHILPRRYCLNASGSKTALASLVVRSEDEVWPKSPDARLIAASPDLLTALKNLLIAETAGDKSKAEKWAFKAIAKAEGRA